MDGQETDPRERAIPVYHLHDAASILRTLSRIDPVETACHPVTSAIGGYAELPIVGVWIVMAIGAEPVADADDTSVVRAEFDGGNPGLIQCEAI